MTLLLKPDTEPIPGYHVTERLGTGGYGEVWKAEAPGGLQKAIKFIYGYLSDEKATRELKALNRIKQIRHPFLLSLERIEVIDGQLVIVTELADASLKDRFQACQEAGLPAIPRAELLAHLRDAADALDFLSENALQHLDVKPENLLLVGGRMKVADFGLLKDIHDRTCSAMGGMTPVYAAPELFDGRPSAASDQYSLAIVYQEMLTGTLPFPGTTAAQLTSQHLHSRPRLESLPASDVDVIAKALAKDPLDRFSCSRELIDALLGTANRCSVAVDAGTKVPLEDPGRETKNICAQDTKSIGSGGLSISPPSVQRPASRSGPFAPRGGLNRPSEPRPHTQNTPPPALAPLVELPPIELATDEVGIRPTLFIGVGGAGGHVLRHLRRRLNHRIGLDNMPLWQFLLIDSDAAALSPQSDDAAELAEDETLAMPLRKPQEYREDSLELLQWLSRRWLYNIPRSLKTEGLRPLGRLALVDHAHQLFEKLRELLARITDGEAAERVQKLSGLKLRNAAPRAFVIASTAGGTGSGMVLDVAYVLRMVMADMGMADEAVCGLLLHSTQRNVSAKDLAVANTYACLSELHHYSLPGAAGSPSGSLAHGQHSTFPAAYFVHLGDRLSDPEFAAAAQSVAEYLYLDAATAGGAFLDKCRVNASSSDQGEFRLRTFGVNRMGPSENLSSEAADWLARRVVEHWLDGSSDGTAARKSGNPAAADNAAEKLIAALELNSESMVQRFQSELQTSCPQAAFKQWVSGVVRESAPSAHESREDRWKRFVAHTKQALGIGADSPGGAQPIVRLPALIESLVTNNKRHLCAQLATGVVRLADQPDNGLSGAMAHAERVLERLRATEQELIAVSTAVHEQLASFTAQPPQSGGSRRAARRMDDSPEAMTDALAQLMGLLAQQQVLEGGLRLARALINTVVTTTESLTRIRQQTRSLLSGFANVAWEGGNLSEQQPLVAGNMEQALRRELHERLPKSADRFEQLVADQIIKPRGGLFALLSTSGEELRGLPARLRTLARRVVDEAVQQLDIAAIVHGPDAAAASQTLKQCIESAKPKILHCGGAHRLMLSVPSGQSSASLVELAAQGRPQIPSVVCDSTADIVVCHEVQEITLANIAAALTHDDPHCVEVAQRLHTRVDVQWSAIDLPQPQPSA